jgi:hypothetical protein
MENLAFLLYCSGHCVSQDAELTCLLRWYYWASRFPSQEYPVVAGIPHVFKASGFTQRVGLGRVSARKSETGSQEIPPIPALNPGHPASATHVVLHPQCPGCPLVTSEWEGTVTVGHKLTCKHLAPVVKAQPWMIVPFETFVSEA